MKSFLTHLPLIGAVLISLAPVIAQPHDPKSYEAVCAALCGLIWQPKASTQQGTRQP